MAIARGAQPIRWAPAIVRARLDVRQAWKTATTTCCCCDRTRVRRDRLQLWFRHQKSSFNSGVRLGERPALGERVGLEMSVRHPSSTALHAFDLAVEKADDPRNPVPPVEEHAPDDGEGAGEPRPQCHRGANPASARARCSLSMPAIMASRSCPPYWRFQKAMKRKTSSASSPLRMSAFE